MSTRKVYRVYDNNKRADCFHHNVGEDWKHSSYPTFQEALAYARQWLGGDNFWCDRDTYPLPKGWNGSKFFYNGSNFVEIREEEVDPIACSHIDPKGHTFVQITPPDGGFFSQYTCQECCESWV